MHILLVLITAWICLNKPEKDLVVMHISNVFSGKDTGSASRNHQG